MALKPHQIAKRAGFKDLKEAAHYSDGWSPQALNQMHRNHPLKFRTTIQGAMINKLNEALRGIG
jgi:hypothetical protein